MTDRSSQPEKAAPKVLANLMRLGSSSIVTMSLGLVLVFSMPQRLGIEAVGHFYSAEALAVMFFSIFCLSMNIYISRHVPCNHDHVKDFLFSVLALELVLFGLILLAMKFILTAMGYDSNLIYYTLIISAFVAFQALQTMIISPVMMGLNYVKVLVRLEVITKIVQVSLVGAVLFFDPDLELVIFGFSFYQVLLVCLCVAYLAKKGHLEMTLQFPLLGLMIKTGFPFLLANLVSKCNSAVSTTLLLELADAKEVGLLGATFRLVGAFLAGSTIINKGLVPACSRKYELEGDEAYSKFLTTCMRHLISVTFFPLLAISLFAKEVTFYILGPEYTLASMMFKIELPYIVLMFILSIQAINLNLTTTGKFNAIIIGLSVGLTALVLYVLIPILRPYYPFGAGSLAAGYGLIISQAFVSICFYFSSHIRFLRWRNLLQICSVLGCLMVPIYFSDMIDELSALTRITILLVTVVTVSALTGLVQGDDIKLLRGFLEKFLKKPAATQA